MLRALTISNFALVAKLDLELGPGLTVITGESGAGKSILLDALSLVLGARLRRSQLRHGGGACDVSAEFDIGARPDSRDALANRQLPCVDGPGLLVRRWASEGRSRAFVNGIPTTLATLRELTEPLVDIHAQKEHQQLLERGTQRRLLDDFGVDAGLVEAVADSHRARQECGARLAEATAAAERDAERASLLRYQVDELNSLGDGVQRVAEMTAEHKRLARASELVADLGAGAATLEDELIGAVARLASHLERADDERLAAALDLVVTAQAQLQEALEELRAYLDAIPEDSARFEAVDAELAALHHMARKHKVATADLARHAEALADELAAIAATQDSADALTAALAEAEQRYRASGAALSAARRAAAGPFCERVNAVLAELGFPEAVLQVDFIPAESAAGLEQVEFQVRTNPRHPAGPLRAIASGGELARIGLAVDVVAADQSRLPCLILDEADVGVGGTGADVLGRLLRRLAKNTQVIVITHAPQIAALGDHHLRAAKTSEFDTVIEPLEGAARVEELARMLGGRAVSDDSRAYARTLLVEGGQAVG